MCDCYFVVKTTYEFKNVYKLMTIKINYMYTFEKIDLLFIF